MSYHLKNGNLEFEVGKKEQSILEGAMYWPFEKEIAEKTGTRYELGYGGFEMLRWKVAQIHGKALRKVQDAFTTPLFAYMADGRKQFYMKHLKGALCRMQANGEISEGAARFIGQPYCKGTLSAKNCNEIYEKIKGYVWSDVEEG